MIAMSDEVKLISQAEAARIAGISRTQILRWLRKGLLTEYRRELDDRRMVDEDELRRKLNGKPVRSVSGQ